MSPHPRSPELRKCFRQTRNSLRRGDVFLILRADKRLGEWGAGGGGGKKKRDRIGGPGAAGEASKTGTFEPKARMPERERG